MPKGIVGPVVARFDQMSTPFQAIVWGRVLPLETFDQAQVLAFYSAVGRQDEPGTAVRRAIAERCAVGKRGAVGQRRALRQPAPERSAEHRAVRGPERRAEHRPEHAPSTAPSPS